MWLDSNEMGHDLIVSMADGISKSDVVLALLSPDYGRSRQCERCAQRARPCARVHGSFAMAQG